MSAVGKSLPRVDGAAKVTGGTKYPIDIQLGGMLHGCLLRSPVPAGRIVKIDTEAASQMSGVQAIITAADTPDTRSGLVLRDHIVFAREKVRYEGEPMAAVAAETLDQAKAAVAAIVFEIEETKPITTVQEALVEDALIIHEQLSEYTNGLMAGTAVLCSKGNITVETIAEPEGVDEAFERAHLIIEDEFETQRQYQAPLETRNAVVIYENGRYIVHTGSQWPFNVRDSLADMLDVPLSNVRVINYPFGGGFGGKLEAILEPYAALLSKATGGHPVKIVNSRSEDLLTASCRENSITKIRSAIDEDGNIIAREFTNMLDCGAYCGETGSLTSLSVSMGSGPYRIGPMRVQSRAIYTNTAPTGAMRGVAGAHLYHATERHMDHIADELGVDRRKYRLRHLIQNGDKLANGQVFDEVHILREAFDAMEKAVPWNEFNTGKDKLQGVGIVPLIWATNPLPATVSIYLNQDGSVVVSSGANDNGSGATTVGVTQIIAGELGLSVDDVMMQPADTDFTAYDGGSQGGRTTVVAGKAAQMAAAELKEKILAMAANLLQMPAENLAIGAGQIISQEGSKPLLPLGQVSLAALFTGVNLSATATFMLPMAEFDPESATGLVFATIPPPVTCHLHMAKVEIDPVTGQVKVLRYIVAQDVGKAINPMAIQGQIQGAVTQGLGLVLWESLRLEDAKYIERTLQSYRLPLAVDVPTVESIILEYPTELGPNGAKGVAEAPLVPAAAVIANAVSDAIGKPFNKIPITPEDVLEALYES